MEALRRKREATLRSARRRLFVAADLDDATRAACAGVAERLRAGGWTGRWVAPETYHVTVAFLGGVDGDRVGDIVAAVRDVIASVHPFDVSFDAVGAFPNKHRPRVVWVGSAEPVPAFGTLCGLVRSALVALGFSFDRHADPHVTLARSDGSQPLPGIEAPRVPRLTIDIVTLYESFTEQSGARYDVLQRWKLVRGSAR